MARKALVDISTSRVCQVVDAGTEFEVAPGLVWRDCDMAVAPEMVYVNDKFIDRPAAAAAAAAAQADTQFEDQVLIALRALVERGDLARSVVIK